MELNKWQEAMRGHIVAMFLMEGILDRLECVHCKQLATSITPINADSTPKRYTCECEKCGRSWYADDRTGSLR